MKALLLVDLQNDFMPGGALPVSSGDEVIPLANRLSLHFDWVIATQDWHPNNHLSFAINQEKSPGDEGLVGGLLQRLWPVHCVQKTWGADFPDTLVINRVKKIFHKGTDKEIDSYSAFYDNAHVKSTGLKEYLQHHHLTTLYIMGVATDYCVKYSVLDALDEGFEVFVIMDGCRAINIKEGDSERAFCEMKEKGAHLILSSEL